MEVSSSSMTTSALERALAWRTAVGAVSIGVSRLQPYVEEAAAIRDLKQTASIHVHVVSPGAWPAAPP